MRIRPIHAVLLCALACAAPAAAQTAPAPIAPSHLQAAQRLMEVSQARKLMMREAERAFMNEITTDPETAPHAAMFREVFMATVPWDEIVTAAARAHAETLSEADLRAAIGFYESEAGRRMSDATPALTERVGRIAEEMMTRQLPELTRRFQERLSSTGKKGQSR